MLTCPYAWTGESRPLKRSETSSVWRYAQHPNTEATSDRRKQRKMLSSPAPAREFLSSWHLKEVKEAYAVADGRVKWPLHRGKWTRLVLACAAIYKWHFALLLLGKMHDFGVPTQATVEKLRTSLLGNFRRMHQTVEKKNGVKLLRGLSSFVQR
eukprot:390464-Amphidinium_carterae.1